MRNHTRTRKRPQEGDVVAAHIDQRGWIFGRVVSTKAHADPYGSWTGLILLYIFRHICPQPMPPHPLLTKDLLFPPLIVDGEPWSKGFLGCVEHRPFEPGEKLAVHCFRNNVVFTSEKYFDEFGRELPQKIEPCGFQGLITLHGLESLIHEHLALDVPVSDGPRPFTTLPPPGVEHCLTLHIPLSDSTDLDLSELERQLTEAIENVEAGEWEGHGTHLETGAFDMRFVGKDVEQMLEAMRPVLCRYKQSLPPGWFLTEHTEYTDARRITL